MVKFKNDGSVNWMIHSFIANDAQNNLYLIISDTSTGYDQIMNKFKELNLKMQWFWMAADQVKWHSRAK